MQYAHPTRVPPMSMSDKDAPDRPPDDCASTAPAGTLLVEPCGRVLRADGRAGEIFQRDVDDLVDQTLADLLTNDCREAADVHLGRAHSGSGVESCELQVSTPSGSTVDVLVQCRTLEEGVLAMSVSDLTGWRNVDPRTLLFEEQLRHAQKMEALGRLSSGIAHDFNNLLTLITGYSRVLLDDLDESAAHRRHLQKVLDASNQAAELVAQLLAFGRDDGPRAAVVNLNDALVEFEAMLQRILGESIEFVALLEPSLANIRINPNQLNQILMNLTINARDAMPDGGRLTFETGECFLGDDRREPLRFLGEGLYVKLSAIDTGCGMDARTAQRIFEPFFTTKDLGQGTGLGLATTRSIVHEYGGEILVDTAPGQGSRFDLYFPTADSSIERLRDVHPSAHAPADGEHIVLVDEHDEVRTMLAEILRQRGYSISDARSATDAIDLVGDPSVALAIIDVGLPKPSIDDLVDWLRRERPQLPILFLSGYTPPSETSEPVELLRKPFTPAELTTKVRCLLDEHG